MMIQGCRDVDGLGVTIQEPRVAFFPSLELLEIAYQARCCGLIIPWPVTGLARALPRLMRLQAAAEALLHRVARVSMES